MKKILFKTSSLVIGGVERAQIEFINYLHRNSNYLCKFVVEYDKRDANVLLMEDIKIKFLKPPELQEYLHQSWQNKNKSLLHKIKYNLAITKDRKVFNTEFNAVAKELQPDIAINFHSKQGFNFKYLQNAKKIVWIHGAVTNPWINRAEGLRYLEQMAKYDKIVCVSKGIMEEVIDIFPALSHKTTYLYNPQDFSKIKLQASEDFTVAERPLASEKFILMVARIDIIQKDFITLISAFDIAKDRGYAGKLYIIGGGNEHEITHLSDWINAAKYKHDITWLGAKPNPFNWMRACDKFVLSSHYEGFGLVLTEALSVSDTVISSDCHWGPGEVLGADDFGYLFPVGDAFRLGELMVSATPKLRTDIDMHLEQFSHAPVFERLEEIINNW